VLTENECLTAMVLAGCSPLFAKKIAGALATLDAEQRELAVAFLAWTLGHGHVCRTDREAHWRRLDSKLRLRYGFALEAEVGDVPC
jgi:hypothetical protein